MADNIENRLQVGLGFKIDDVGGGLANFIGNTEKVNAAMGKLAKTMSEVEGASKKTNGGFTESQNIMNHYKAGLIDSRTATDRLVKEQKRLNEQLSKVKEGTKLYDKLAAQLARTNEDMKVLTRERVAYEKEAQREISDINKQLFEDQKLLNKQLTVDYQNSIRQRVNAHKQLDKAYRSTTSLGDKMFNTFMRVSGIHLLVNEFRKLGQEIVSIEYNTINNQRLMGDFSDELRDSLNNSAAEIAKNTGIAITDAQEIQGAWIRINEQYAKSAELLGSMSDITAKFMNVSGITEAEEAVKLLNSSLLQFNLTGANVAENLEEIGSKFAYMADTTAMGTADEYAQGIAKMGANVKNMNGDIDDAIVLLSIVGDKLAKNGAEAGNALNTVTAYMHRTKTLKLFDNLAKELGDANLSLRDGEKGLKSYRESIETIAEAYRRLKEAGNEVGVNQIIEALGATRQRATTQALLDAISSPDGQNLDYYETLLDQATTGGNYLEEQNAKLMESIKNQGNALVASLQQAGMAFANAGVLDGITLLMNAGERMFNFFSSLPEPILRTVTTLLQFKVATKAIEKISAISGIANKLNQFTTRMQVGTKSEIAYSKALSTTSQDLMLQEQLLLKKAEIQAYSANGTAQERISCLSWKQALTTCNQEIAELDTLLAQGLITTEQHNQGVRASVAAYNAKIHSTEHGTNVVRQNTINQTANNQTIRDEIILDEGAAGSKNKLTFAEKQNNVVKKSSLLTAMQTWATKTKERLATDQETASENANTASTTANTLAKWGLKVAADAVTASVQFLSGAMVVLNSAMGVITFAMLGLSLFGGSLFGGAKSSTEDYTDSLGSLEEALQSGRERVEELRAAQENTGDVDGAIQKQIDKQNELNESYQNSINLLKQKQFYDDYYGESDDGNKDEDISGHINTLNEYEKALADIETKIANVAQRQKEYEDIIANGGTLTDSQVAAYNSATASLSGFQEEMADLNRNAGASAAILNQYADEIREAYDEGLISDTDWNTKFKGLVDDIEQYRSQIDSFLSDVKTGITEVNESLSTSLDLSDLMNQMDSLAESTKSLVEAQNQLAQGTALSKDHLWELAMQYPELLYQSDLFADGSVAGQQAAIDAILDMKNQEFNNSIDLKIAELEADKEFVTNILELEEQKLNALLDGEKQVANGKFEIKDGELAFLTEFNNAEGEQVALAQQYKINKVAEGAGATVDVENQANEKVVNGSYNTGEAIATNITEGSAAGADGAKKNASNVMNIFSSMLSGLGGLAQSVAAALAGDRSGIWGNVNTVDGSGDSTNSFSGKKTINPQDIKIDGKTVSEWIELQKKDVLNKVKDYTVTIQGIDNAISNLNTFKNAGLTGVSNKYSDKGAQGGTGKSGEAAKAAEKAAKASEKAAKEASKATEEIEKMTQTFVKNVESLQDRIAKALKKKYQEQYDERKKLLEKEHEDRVQQIQDEIDKINGDTPKDKQSELDRLQSKYEQWSKDDSTLGKSKQKEYLDQINELKKEIKIDELEKKLDEENERYDQSIDKDSQFYDAILKKLDKQMTDEMVYREANDMIRNGKIQEITDLLTKYDAQWDGWATLMGKTAGEIIAEEVASAIANYLDVVNGTVTATGGKYSGTVSTSKTSSSGKATTPTSKSTGTSGGTVTKGSKVKINDKSAGMYYTSTSSGAVGNWNGYSGSYYVVNTNANRVALARDNNINNAIGWISKSKVTKLATGGYTGLGEGLAFLHAKERVLNARQTAAFENLIYNQLPKLERQSVNGGNFGGTTNTFNKELVKVQVDTINNYDSADVTNMGDNLDRMFRVSLQKAGIRKPR